MLRQLIITVMGNVDAGKTQLLDTIRSTSIVESEPGKITQSIGCSVIPIDTIKKICGKLLENHSLSIKVPGFVIIDTPGHAAFTNLRRRGGNLADIAILVIDINEGVKLQTIECIDILKQYKTPFVVALNKIDLLPGWNSSQKTTLLESIQKQNESIMLLIEKRLYEAVGKLSELGFNSERFDRVEDYTKQIAIIPTSAKTAEGLAELLMVAAGLSQKFLEENLKVNVEGNAKGTILEAKQEKGLGATIDVIIYDGSLKQNDTIVVGSLDEPVSTKVKALFVPMPLAEMGDKKAKFKSVKEVKAAIGVKISAPELDKVVAGMPLRSCAPDEVQKTKDEIKKEVDPLQSVILGFNVELLPEVKVPQNVKVLCSNVIYKLIEDFEKWQEEERKRLEGKEVEYLVKPCKIKILRGYVFRQNNPAVVGAEILAGTLKAGAPLMKDDGDAITEAKSMQQEQENVEKAEKGKQIAVSLPNVTIGRQVKEDDILYSAVPEGHFRKFKEFKKSLSQEEIEILKEIAEIMRKKNPLWGI